MAGKEGGAGRLLSGARERLAALYFDELDALEARRGDVSVSAEVEKRARALGVMARTGRNILDLAKAEETFSAARDDDEETDMDDDDDLSDDKLEAIRAELKVRLARHAVARETKSGDRPAGPGGPRDYAADHALACAGRPAPP